MQLFEVLTAQRLRVVEVARTKPCSVTGLAKMLRRGPTSVRRDVAKLEQHGVVRTREEINPGHGRMKMVEPVAERFELRVSFAAFVSAFSAAATAIAFATEFMTTALLFSLDCLGFPLGFDFFASGLASSVHGFRDPSGDSSSSPVPNAEFRLHATSLTGRCG
jgi:hypothetical protein